MSRDDIEQLIRNILRELSTAENESIRAWVREDTSMLIHDQVASVIRPRIDAEVQRHVGEMLGRASLENNFSAAVDALVQKEVHVALERAGEQARDPARTLGIFPDEPVEGSALPSVQTFLDQPTTFHPDSTLLERSLSEYAERDALPLPTTDDREGYYGDRHYEYWLRGLDEYLRVKRVLARHGAEVAAPFALLDLGCATGRVIRHFLCQDDGLEVWGVDLNERHVQWLVSHMPPELKVFQCTALPTLNLPDASLDLATAFSVFTHIDEYELAWLAELRRVLKPGGIAYLTVHSDLTWAKLKPGVTVYDHLERLDGYITDFEITPQLFQQPMPREKTVFRWRFGRVNNTNVFQTRDYIERAWGRFFEIVEFIEEGSDYQDVVVLRRPG